MPSRRWLVIAIALLTAGALGIVMVSREESQKKAQMDAALTRLVTSAISKVRVPAESAQLYREVTSNRDCNRADATIVYSVNLEPKDICESLYSTLGKSWQANSCRERTGRFANNPPYVYEALEASSEEGVLGFLLGAYRKDARAQFLPINEYIENDVIKLANKFGRSYFYVHVEYRGAYERSKYPCNEGNAECYCVSSTSYESTANEVRRSLQ